MVGVNFFVHRLGTVAIFATLFVAIYVNGEKEFVFDNEHDNLALDCKGSNSSWVVNALNNLKKKVFILEPEKEGCLKTKQAVAMNSTSAVVLKFMHEGAEDDTGKVIISLKPIEGTCPDEECSWNVNRDPKYKKGDWVAVEHKFPLTSTKEYHVQLHVEKSKGKFMVDHIAVPGAVVDFLDKVANDPGCININEPDQLVSANGNDTGAAGLMEISKNLIVTSASVLTLNNLLN